jgi:glutamate-1-semialdehyde 2,1-aminomutase
MNADPILNQAVSYLPGGAIFTLGYNVPGPPEIVFSHGHGAYVYSTTGVRFLDVVLGSGALLLGHCPPAVVAAARQQLECGTAFSQISPPVIELARLMVEAVPCAEKVRFTNSGSEAVLLALRLVRAFTRQEKILKFEGAYHGFPDALLFHTNYGTPGEWPGHPRASPDTLGMPAGLSNSVLIAPYNDMDRTREIIREHHSELAAIFVEPVMRGIESVPGFLEGVRELATHFSVPLVFDEVITGFRLAYGGAQQYYGVTADIAVYGKGLGAGFPIGAVAGNDEIMSYLDPASPDGRRVYALGSLHGNPLCAAADGEQLRQGLAELFARHRLEAQMTGAGSIVEFFFTSEPITDYRSAMRSNLRMKGLLGRQMPRHGVNGGGGRYNASTCHGDDELALLLEAVGASLGVIEEAGGLS